MQIVLEKSPEQDRLYSAVVNSDVGRGGTEKRNRGANSKSTNQAIRRKLVRKEYPRQVTVRSKVEGVRWTEWRKGERLMEK